MIRQALRHLPGLGPERLRRLAEAGIEDWTVLRSNFDALRMGPAGRDKLAAAIDRCEQALQEADLRFLTTTLHARDQWRILGEFFDRAAYFDIETSGLDIDSYITLIACEHQEDVHTFVHNENLDAFLDLLENVELLVSFNGASFDVPRVLGHYHIPSLPTAHIDLRWICYHDKLQGGLKSIERRLDIGRPPDLDGVDGEEAVWLWQLWEDRRHQDARERLIRYCCADVLALKLLAARLLEDKSCPVSCPSPSTVWSQLDRVCDTPDPPAPPKPALEPPPLGHVERRLEQHWQRLRQRP